MPATLAVLLLALVIIGSAVAFSIPNRTPRPDGGAALTRYLPLIDGDAALSTRVDASGGAAGWEAANTDVLGDGEALLSLTVTTFTQLTTLYGSAEKDPVPPGHEARDRPDRAGHDDRPDRRHRRQRSTQQRDHAGCERRPAR